MHILLLFHVFINKDRKYNASVIEEDYLIDLFIKLIHSIIFAEHTAWIQIPRGTNKIINPRPTPFTFINIST